MSSCSVSELESNKQLPSLRGKKGLLLYFLLLYQRITSSWHHQRCKTSCYCMLKPELADRQAETDLRRCLGDLLRFTEGVQEETGDGARI